MSFIVFLKRFEDSSTPLKTPLPFKSHSNPIQVPSFQPEYQLTTPDSPRREYPRHIQRNSNGRHLHRLHRPHVRGRLPSSLPMQRQRRSPPRRHPRRNDEIAHLAIRNQRTLGDDPLRTLRDPALPHVLVVQLVLHVPTEQH